MKRFPVVTYHSLDDSGSVISISPAQFRWQMEFLRGNGWRTLSLDELLAGHTRGEWPARTFALTFDDGYANFAEHALPVLTVCSFSAIVFVIGEFVGRKNDWRCQSSSVPRCALMDWNSLRVIVDAGMEIGGHSLSHPRLTGVTKEESEREITGCKQVIEDRIGGVVRAFAYPYGETTHALEAIVSKYYRAGFGTQLGFATPTSRATAFERIDAFYLRQPRFFRALETGRLFGYLKIRRWLRGLRQHFEGNGM